MTITSKNSKKTPSVPFIDLKAQQDKIRPQIEQAIMRVLDHGKYIMGPEVFALEENLSEYCGAKYAISCSSGTDALLMVLMAKDVGRGDAIFLPSFTYTATPEVVALLGATPIFLDVLPDTFNINPDDISEGVKIAQAKGLKPKAIIAVDLFGQPAEYERLHKIAEKHNLWILADAAQSFGASSNNRKVGSLAFATATSFFPAKPLGCYGDGGAIFTDDSDLNEILKSIRVHGKGSSKYDNVRVGLNARLDTLQAAILLEKLKIFDEEIEERQHIADKYNAALEGTMNVPLISRENKSAWAQYTIKVKPGMNRQAIVDRLQSAGVPTMIYYEKPLHLQTAYKNYPTVKSLEASETLSKTVLSLPMSPSLDFNDLLIGM
tara:strand:- start:1222 stop:2355 length:1134 start_codon:yes stop_codon:yes gene_type:complete